VYVKLAILIVRKIVWKVKYVNK